MKSDYILFKSLENNSYLYSFNKNQILLINPIISFFLNLRKNKIEIKRWINNNKSNEYIIKDIGTFTKKEILYQYKKYLFLQNNKYFEDKNINNTLRYTGNDIKYQLANTSQISFEVTDSCNLECEYCIYGKFYTNRNKPQNINLNIETAKRMLDYLAELWNSSLNSSQKNNISIGFYGGEALLNIEFIYEIVNYIKKLPLKHNSFTFDMTTNGVLLNKYIPFFVENNFNIVISLDGGLESNNIYRKFSNQQSAFKQIYKNILSIKEKYPQYFEEHINFNSVLHNRNSYAKLYEFFLSKFNKTPLITELDITSVNPDLADEFSLMQNNSYESLHKDKNYATIEKEHYVGDVEDLTNFLFANSGYVKSSYLELIYNNKSQLPTGTCPPFSRKIFVTAKGHILPCERIGHQFVLGHVDNNNVWLDFEIIAKKYNEFYDKIYKQCDNCYLKRTCGICMFKQNLETDDFKCTGFMNYSSIVEKFSHIISYVEQNPEIYSKILKKTSYI